MKKKWFTPGSSPPEIINFEGWKVAVIICYEIEFPEPARVLAIQGAQLIIVPTATTCRFNCEYTVRSRAYELLQMEMFLQWEISQILSY